jgi:hypothetical protein
VLPAGSPCFAPPHSLLRTPNCLQASGYPNQCFRPTEVASPNATYLYGECQFYDDNVGERTYQDLLQTMT